MSAALVATWASVFSTKPCRRLSWPIVWPSSTCLGGSCSSHGSNSRDGRRRGPPRRRASAGRRRTSGPPLSGRGRGWSARSQLAPTPIASLAAGRPDRAHRPVPGPPAIRPTSPGAADRPSALDHPQGPGPGRGEPRHGPARWACRARSGSARRLTQAGSASHRSPLPEVGVRGPVPGGLGDSGAVDEAPKVAAVGRGEVGRIGVHHARIHSSPARSSRRGPSSRRPCPRCSRPRPPDPACRARVPDWPHDRLASQARAVHQIGAQQTAVLRSTSPTAIDAREQCDWPSPPDQERRKPSDYPQRDRD